MASCGNGATHGLDARAAFSAHTVRDAHAGCVYFPTFTRFSTCKVRKYANRKCFTRLKNHCCEWSANELSSRTTVAGGRVSRSVDPHDMIVCLQGHVSTTQTELQSRTAVAVHLNTAIVFVCVTLAQTKKNARSRPRHPEHVAPATMLTPGPGLGPCPL